jgi:pimeloyl-ACP methyl ester carboxylesterase
LIEELYSRTTQLQLPESVVCCLRQGQGPAVTFLHGVPLSLLTWRHNLDVLARDHTVVAFDLKGFGRSQKPPGDYSPEAHACVLGRVIDALRIDKTSLVASSYGCAPAIRFALDQKERVESLVLINSVGYPGGRHSIERLLRIGGVAAMLRFALRHNGLGRVLFMSRLRRSYADGATLSMEVAKGYFQMFLREGGEERFLLTLRQFDEAALAAAIPAITQPTLIIWGGRDRILPVANARLLQEDIPGAKLHILPNAGHLPHEENPDEVNRLIAEFLTVAPTRDRTAVSENWEPAPC